MLWSTRVPAHDALGLDWLDPECRREAVTSACGLASVAAEERSRRGAARFGQGGRGQAASRVGGCAIALHGWQVRAQPCATLTHCRASGPRTGDSASLGRAANDQGCACDGPTRRGGSVRASNSLEDRRLLPGRCGCCPSSRRRVWQAWNDDDRESDAVNLPLSVAGWSWPVLVSRRDLRQRCAAAATQRTLRARGRVRRKMRFR